MHVALDNHCTKNDVLEQVWSEGFRPQLQLEGASGAGLKLGDAVYLRRHGEPAISPTTALLSDELDGKAQWISHTYSSVTVTFLPQPHKTSLQIAIELPYKRALKQPQIDQLTSNGRYLPRSSDDPTAV
jgi:hypothetical protein